MSHYVTTNHLASNYSLSIKFEKIRTMVSSCLKIVFLLLLAVISVGTVPLLFWFISK